MTATMKKYADVVRAYLDGAEVQCRLIRDKGKWLDISEPKWDENTEYRIKPKEPRIVEKFALVGTIFDENLGVVHWINGAYACEIKDEYRYHSQYNDKYKIIANIKLLCNEETGEVISVELIK